MTDGQMDRQLAQGKHWPGHGLMGSEAWATGNRNLAAGYGTHLG